MHGDERAVAGLAAGPALDPLLLGARFDYGLSDGTFDERRGVSGEVVSAAIGESTDGEYQSVIALDNQVQDVNVIARVLLRNGDHQGKIRFHQILLGKFGLLIAGPNMPDAIHLLIASHWRNVANFVQIDPYRIIFVHNSSSYIIEFAPPVCTDYG